ncbi:MAG: glycosidase [Kiritimatiellales bacterium]
MKTDKSLNHTGCSSVRPGLLARDPHNPVLRAEDWCYPVNAVFNPGAVRLRDTGETLLLTRVEDRRGISHLCAARSADGIGEWKIDDRPTLAPDPEHHPEELWGIEDPRITWIPELEQYAVVSAVYSRGGPGVGLFMTRDFRAFERRGMIFPPADKDAALFPRRFNGRWAMIHRPFAPTGREEIWVSFSPDLMHWGSHRMLMPAREGAWWDARKVGLATPPIETDEGWLIIYHGVRETAAGHLYRVGIALLDLQDPTRLIRRGDHWIFGPYADYEREGDVSNVVFPCGIVPDDDGDGFKLYYGAGDMCVCLATGRISTLLEWLKNNHYEGTA